MLLDALCFHSYISIYTFLHHVQKLKGKRTLNTYAISACCLVATRARRLAKEMGGASSLGSLPALIASKPKHEARAVKELTGVAEDSPGFLSRSGATLTPGSVIWRPGLIQAEFLEVWM